MTVYKKNICTVDYVFQIDELERSLREERTSGDSKLDSIRDKYEQQIGDLTAEINKLTQDYDKKLASLSSELEFEWSKKLNDQESAHQVSHQINIRNRDSIKSLTHL